MNQHQWKIKQVGISSKSRYTRTDNIFWGYLKKVSAALQAKV